MSNQKGMTLVELLAAITLMSLVSVLLISIIVQSQNAYKRSQLTNLTTTEISYLINSITRDIRQSPENVTVENNKLIILPNDGSTIVYFQEVATLKVKRNSQDIISQVKDFTVSADGGSIDLEVVDSNSKAWTSTIVIRTGGEK